MPHTLDNEAANGNYTAALMIKWTYTYPNSLCNSEACWWTGLNVIQNHFHLDDIIIREWSQEINSRASTLETPSTYIVMKLKRVSETVRAKKKVATGPV